MNLERFRSSPSGRLVRGGVDNFAYWAFAPNPLPPPLVMDLPLLHALSSADRALGELAGLGRAVSNPHLLIRPFIRREAVLSSRIEGTQAGMAELYAYEAGHPPIDRSPAAEADVREVLNYVQALEYGLERLQTLPVSLRLLRELHERLMAGVRGERMTPGDFRRSQNWIGRPGCTLNDADYVPPPVEEMSNALYALENYLHDGADYPPLIRLALIHYQFEAIHPFLDGNGRIGRLLIVLLLMHWELLPLPLLYLSAWFHEHRERYYDLLMRVSERGAWNEWVVFFLDGVSAQAGDAIRRAKQLQDLQIGWHEKLHAERGTGLMHGVVDMLFRSPVMTASDVTKGRNVTHRTAMATLRRLVSLDILEETMGKQRQQQFVANSIFRVVE